MDREERKYQLQEKPAAHAENLYLILGESYDAAIGSLTDLQKKQVEKWNDDNVEVRMIKKIKEFSFNEFEKTAFALSWNICYYNLILNQEIYII